MGCCHSCFFCWKNVTKSTIITNQSNSISYTFASNNPTKIEFNNLIDDDQLANKFNEEYLNFNQNTINKEISKSSIASLLPTTISSTLSQSCDLKESNNTPDTTNINHDSFNSIHSLSQPSSPVIEKQNENYNTDGDNVLNSSSNFDSNKNTDSMTIRTKSANAVNLIANMSALELRNLTKNTNDSTENPNLQNPIQPIEPQKRKFQRKQSVNLEVIELEWDLEEDLKPVGPDINASLRVHQDGSDLLDLYLKNLNMNSITTNQQHEDFEWDLNDYATVN